MTTKKKSSVKKAPASKTKKNIQKKSAPKTPAVKKKSPIAKKLSGEHFENVLTKEALKLVDEAAILLRNGIKTSQKNTSKAREAAHKKAHNLLGKATRHLDDALKSGSSFLRKTIGKI